MNPGRARSENARSTANHRVAYDGFLIADLPRTLPALYTHKQGSCCSLDGIASKRVFLSFTGGADLPTGRERAAVRGMAGDLWEQDRVAQSVD